MQNFTFKQFVGAIYSFTQLFSIQYFFFLLFDVFRVWECSILDYNFCQLYRALCYLARRA